MKNLDKSQMPKLIALGVVAAGLFGYVVYSMFGNSTPTPAVAATPPAALLPPTDAATQPENPVLQLAAIHHPDPFKPAFEPQTAPPPPAPKPAAKPPAPKPATKPQLAAASALRDEFDSPPMDALPAFVKVTELGPSAPSQPPAPPKPAPAPKPAAKPAPAPAPPPSPPAVVVTGILEGDENVAILKWNDSHRQVVRVGDRLDGGYVIKTIRPEAVVVARGKHQWTVRLGAERPESN
jgi:hypothetical protein